MSVYFYGCITLDGYLADKNHGLDWLHQTGSVEETTADEFYDQMDITLMGKKTFNEIKDLENASDIYSKTTNYVFTHSESLGVDGFIAVQGDVVEFVQGLATDQNIWIIGGNTILAPLLDADLVDHMIIQIAPVLLGAGIPLFTQKEALKRFKLREVKQYGQFAELVYDRNGNLDSVEPEDWEKKIAQEWFAMSDKEKSEGIAIEKIAKEFKIELE